MNNSRVKEAADALYLALQHYDDADDWLQQKMDDLNEVRAMLHDIAPSRGNPVDLVRWVPIEKVTPNDYNPNKVALAEMVLLRKSIEHDGYTQPVVTIRDDERDLYVIVDGFHRYFVLRETPELLKKNGGRLPIVVIEKDLAERMASTVRHNRARGKHSINGMANTVYAMLEEGLSDAEVCNALGLEPEELLKLKHVTGYSKLYADGEFGRAWVTASQVERRQEYLSRQE